MKYLILVDMQNDFIDGSLGTEEARAIVNNVMTKIASHQGELVFTMDTHTQDYLKTQEGINLPIEHCIKGTRGWEICDVLKPYAEKSAVIYKGTFGGTELIEHLKKRPLDSQKDEIELVGLCTDICVVSNALLIKAFFPEIKICVDASCCAGVTPDSHNHAIAVMKMCHIDIKD